MDTAERRNEIEQATGLKLYSRRLSGAIKDLDKLHKSLLFAELSNIAYLRKNLATRAAREIGISTIRFFDRDGSQAYIFENDFDCTIICRGTEPNEWNDIKADVNAASVVAETIGRVHKGFKQEVDDLWPELESALVENKKTLWIAGHSLGGAMATICASRCKLSHIQTNPIELYTFGSPRVGNNRYVNYSVVVHIRWVNNNDIVTRVPPNWLGYRHTGEEMYLNAYGKIRKITPWQRTKDRWRGFWMGLKAGRIDPFNDHLLEQYARSIYNEICARECGGRTG
jgi:triacylglycerol lipase